MFIKFFNSVINTELHNVRYFEHMKQQKTTIFMEHG